MKTAISMQVAHLIAQLLIAGNLFTLLIGVMMLVAPQRLASMFKVSDRWVSTKRAFEPLDMVHETDNIALRYPRVLGVILVVGAAFILIRGGILPPASAPPKAAGCWHESLVPVRSRPRPGGPLVEFGRRRAAERAYGVGTGRALALQEAGNPATAFGVANRWVATHHIFDQLDKPYYGLNKLIHEKSRIWGACITVFSLCAIFLLIWYLRR